MAYDQKDKPTSPDNSAQIARIAQNAKPIGKPGNTEAVVEAGGKHDAQKPPAGNKS